MIHAELRATDERGVYAMDVLQHTEEEKRYIPRDRRSSPALGPLTIPPAGFMRNFIAAAIESRARPFVGVRRAADPNPPRHTPIASTGVSTSSMVAAADAFLDALPLEERIGCMFGIESDVYRSWCNFHSFLFRRGACLYHLDAEQRRLALALLEQSMSPLGYETARNVMRLNEHLGDVTGRPDEFGEWYYWLSIMGVPSATEPWGFQLDGHHLNINCFVLGDQVVLTPTFMASEPVSAESGPYAGTRVFAEEERLGLRMIEALTPDQVAQTVVGSTLPFDVLAHPFNDDFIVPDEGIGADTMSAEQRERLADLIRLYVSRERPGHAELRLAEALAHLDQTRFAWIGEWQGDEACFYYRIDSPVIMIEFVHQPGVMFANALPSRRHAHTLVRTPNGNDYGKSLLRQYYERSRLVARTASASLDRPAENAMDDLQRGR
jgi:hypothetical protein